MPDGEEHSVTFTARYLTRIKLRYSILTVLVNTVAWTVRKLCHYTMFSVEVRVVLLTMVVT